MYTEHLYERLSISLREKMPESRCRPFAAVLLALLLWHLLLGGAEAAAPPTSSPPITVSDAVGLVDALQQLGPTGGVIHLTKDVVLQQRLFPLSAITVAQNITVEGRSPGGGYPRLDFNWCVAGSTHICDRAPFRYRVVCACVQKCWQSPGPISQSCSRPAVHTIYTSLSTAYCMGFRCLVRSRSPKRRLNCPASPPRCHRF